MKKVILAAIVAFFCFSLIGLSSVYADDDYCQKSPGYWKNHPDAWPVEEVLIGDVLYDKDQALALMQQPVKGDKWLTLFKATVAAKLNVINCGCPGRSVNLCIGSADNFFRVVAEDYAEWGLIPASSEYWQSNCGGEAAYLCLDEYNNGN